MNINLFSKLNHTDLNMYQCGIEKCCSGHYFGPAIRDHFLIHYIFSGKGIFRVGNKTYHLQKGNGFLICPNIITYYKADKNNPWKYAWVGFHGLKAELYLKYANLNVNNPIFKYIKDDYIKSYFLKMTSIKKMTKSKEIESLGYLYIFLSKLIDIRNDKQIYKNTKQLYVTSAVNFIKKNYSRKITINEIANYLGLDRSYLYSIFKKYLNISPQKYLINFRINKACELMQNNHLCIGDISRSVGYDDQLLFSKTFKKMKGLCPREYRKKL